MTAVVMNTGKVFTILSPISYSFNLDTILGLQTPPKGSKDTFEGFKSYKRNMKEKHISVAQILLNLKICICLLLHANMLTMAMLIC